MHLNHYQQSRFLQNNLNRLLCILIAGLSLALSGCTGTYLLDRENSAFTPHQPVSHQPVTGPYPEIRISDEAAKGTAPIKGEGAPAFQLAYQDGVIIDSSSLRGKPILLNFWATWCGPCRREMPAIVAQAQANEDVIIIAVNEMEALKQLQPFVEEFEMERIVARDIDGKSSKRFGVQGLPTSIFIDRDGKIAAIWQGYLSAEMLDELLAKIL